jgi:hypothetical protein
LHLDVVRKTNPYFDQEHEAPLRGMPFKPHITLTSFEDKNVIDDIPPLTFAGIIPRRRHPHMRTGPFTFMPAHRCSISCVNDTS